MSTNPDIRRHAPPEAHTVCPRCHAVTSGTFSQLDPFQQVNVVLWRQFECNSVIYDDGHLHTTRKCDIRRRRAAPAEIGERHGS